MDLVTSSDEGDWAETKELAKNERYRMHIYFSIILAPSMADLGTAQKPTSQLEQAAPSRRPNFKTDSAFSDSVTNSKASEKIRVLTVSKTLTLSDIILKLFHVYILRSPEWALISLPTELANSQTSALILMAFITGNSSLEPLLKGLLAQIHIDLSRRVFGRNRSGDLRITQIC